ncbi:MAG: nicotinate-nucleotide--dimethylbenzimidazole phosphoribosyltransferase [Pseudoruegeria sp.]
MIQTLPVCDNDAKAAAELRNGNLTKPPGALGQLEELAIWYASWRGMDRPEVMAPQVVVFAGNHGVASLGVSAFPGEVTVQMVENFRHGGAAINQLCKAAGASLDVVALSLDTPTQDFTHGPAMSEEDFLDALNVGWDSVQTESDLLVVGEMGIANTTSAAAIFMALHGGCGADWTGLGTGISADDVPRKVSVVEQGVDVNQHDMNSGLDVLRCLGGRELAAMAGAAIRARVLSIPVIMDGFVCTAAFSCLAKDNPAALDHVVAGHQSAEQAHVVAVQKIGKMPLLNLDMRLGEGSGGALAIQILKGAVACHSGMATFAEAGVSTGE